MFHGGFMNTNDAYVKVEGIIRDNESITKMGIIREAWKVGINRHSENPHISRSRGSPPLIAFSLQQKR